LPEGAEYLGHRWLGTNNTQNSNAVEQTNELLSLKCPNRIETGTEQELEINFRCREEGIFALPVRYTSERDHIQMDRIHHLMVTGKQPSG